MADQDKIDIIRQALSYQAFQDSSSSLAVDALYAEAVTFLKDAKVKQLEDQIAGLQAVLDKLKGLP